MWDVYNIVRVFQSMNLGPSRKLCGRLRTLLNVSSSSGSLIEVICRPLTIWLREDGHINIAASYASAPKKRRHIIFECRYFKRIWEATTSWFSCLHLMLSIGLGRLTVLKYWQALA
jgi:hypothetical protein